MLVMKLDINFALIQVIRAFTNFQVFLETKNHKNSSFVNAQTTCEPQITQIGVSKVSL